MRKRPDIGQTSDIAFLLILFFLVLATLGQSKALTLDMPKHGETTSFTSTDPILITLDEQGIISSDTKNLSYSELIELLTQEPHLQLAIKENTLWEDVVKLLALIEQYPPASLQMEAVI